MYCVVMFLCHTDRAFLLNPCVAEGPNKLPWASFRQVFVSVEKIFEAPKFFRHAHALNDPTSSHHHPAP